MTGDHMTLHMKSGGRASSGRWGTFGRLACAAFVAGGSVLGFASVAGASSTTRPSPVPGDDGTVKIHEQGTGTADDRNEPHVCKFYLDAFGFDAAQSVTWTIAEQPPTGRTSVLSGATVLGAEGAGRTGILSLPAGHYRLTWTFTGEHGKGGKHKTFWVDCGEAASPPVTQPATHPPHPSHSPHPTKTPCPTPSPTTSPSTSPSTTPTPTEATPTSASPSPTSTAGGSSAGATPSPTSAAPTAVEATSPVTGGLARTGFGTLIAVAAIVLLAVGSVLFAIGRLKLYRSR